MKKQRVAFLISHPIQYFSPLFKKLAEQPAIDLTVLYCSDESVRGMRDSGFGSEIKWDIPLLEGYKYKFLKNHSPFPTIFKAPFGLLNFGIIREIRHTKYDALIMHGWHYVTFWLAHLVARAEKIPVFMHSESPLNQELLKPGWKLALKKIILGWLFNSCKRFLAIGSENRKFYEYYGVPSEKIFLTPYAVDNERLVHEYEANRHRKVEFRKEAGILPDSVVILFSGKLVAKKRPMDLLRAFELLESKTLSGESVSKSPSPFLSAGERDRVRGAAELVFVGDGPLRASLEKYVAAKGIKNVHFVGFKNQSELHKYYIAADIFILPSGMGETWGLVVNEAMCFGLPLIVSETVGCSADLVRDGINGYKFPEGNINELAGQLQKLVKDKTLREKMGIESRAMINKWHHDACIAGMIKALGET